MFKSIGRFFLNVYLGVVSFFTACFMSVAFSMMYHLLAFKSNDRNHVESLATRFAHMTAGMVRQVVVLKGKDPDYVAPPPPPPEPTMADAANTMGRTKNSSNVGPAYQAPWAKDAFKDIRKHPVIASRLALEAREAAKNAPAVVDPPAMTVLSDPLPIEESSVELDETDFEKLH
jgi:hypothetical protein